MDHIKIHIRNTEYKDVNWNEQIRIGFNDKLS
jgi:hypothetical protein